MTETTQLRVRPAFRRASILVFVALLPLVAYSVWDYIESRRLTHAIDAIYAKREPLAPIRVSPMPDPDAEAERYYRAAAALAFEPYTIDDTTRRIMRADSTAQWPSDLIPELRQHVARFDEATRLADRAATLPFHGLTMTDGYWNSALAGLASELSRRAQLRALDGDGDGAIESLHSALQMQRPFDNRLFGVLRFPRDFAFVVGNSLPSGAALATLAEPLAASDTDDGPRRYWLRLRALILDQSPAVRPQGHWEDIATRPFTMHALVRQLDEVSALLAAADAPWPERIDRTVEVGRYPTSPRQRDPLALLRGLIEFQADRLAIIRCSRVAVAMERYRAEHGTYASHLDDLTPTYLPEPPRDPYTGKSILLSLSADSYAVYSVGRNRRDDGGADLGTRWSTAPVMSSATYGIDVGIRIPRSAAR
jgi:hypothetical protein